MVMEKMDLPEEEMEKINKEEAKESAETMEDNAEKMREIIEKEEKRDLETVRSEIDGFSHSEEGLVLEKGLAAEYIKKSETVEGKKGGVFRGLQSMIMGRIFKKIYSKYPEVAKGNDPESENFYLKQVDRDNEQREQEAEELGFDKKIAFFGHMHSRGEKHWKDGSDGSLTPEEILEEYKKAKTMLGEKGVDDVYIALCDHGSVNNSIALAKLMEEEGVAKPIVGVESATKDGYEILSYTTDTEKLKDYNTLLETKLGKIFRNIKSGHPGKELIKRMAEDNFVMGAPHPSAQKAILLGGTLGERMEKDPELKELISKHMTFYEGMNWFQDPKGSNCIAYNMCEKMEELGVVPFANEDFHSKVEGGENTFFNGMYTEIRTSRDIKSGEDLLELFREQNKNPQEKFFVPILRGAPATAPQYKEHLGRASKQNIKNVIKAVFGSKK